MKDWKNDEVKLVNEDGIEISVGDKITDCNEGQDAYLRHCLPPHKSSSQGKIIVEWADEKGSQREYYPSVFNLKYEKVSPVDEVKLSFICIGRNAWGRGLTLKEARKVWSKAGGTGRCDNIAVVAYTGETHPYVDELGTFYTEKGAKIGWLRKDGKQA